MADIEVFIPTAETRNRVAPMARRLDHLAGKKVAWVDNQKANAHALLAGAAAALHKQQSNFEISFHSKNATQAAPDALIAHLKTCDAVVLAIAD